MQGKDRLRFTVLHYSVKKMDALHNNISLANTHIEMMPKSFAEPHFNLTFSRATFNHCVILHTVFLLVITSQD